MIWKKKQTGGSVKISSGVFILLIISLEIYLQIFSWFQEISRKVFAKCVRNLRLFEEIWQNMSTSL